MLLTDLATVFPPRIGHFIARLLGLSAAHAMFCPCCDIWGDDDD